MPLLTGRFRGQDPGRFLKFDSGLDSVGVSSMLPVHVRGALD